MLLRIEKLLGKHFRTYSNAGCQQLGTHSSNRQKMKKKQLNECKKKSFNVFKYTYGYPCFVLTDSLSLLGCIINDDRGKMFFQKTETKRYQRNVWESSLIGVYSENPLKKQIRKWICHEFSHSKLVVRLSHGQNVRGPCTLLMAAICCGCGCLSFFCGHLH